jgi:hypothetical protein
MVTNLSIDEDVIVTGWHGNLQFRTEKASTDIIGFSIERTERKVPNAIQ